MTNAVIEKKQVIIGTAGHVDHGKTALVEALTGMDADTLAEEKRRGMTIELGFIFMDARGFDRQVVFIDVPGHEKFIKTMVAGASSIDAVLLVIAADEGISAQTAEHFEILEFLGIKSGAIAVTKTDLVDNECIRAVIDKIEDFVSGTFLDGSSIVAVSSVTGEGIEKIKSVLFDICRKVEKRYDSGIFRMPIDRVFTMQGFGTVIAGTVLSGEVKVGDTIEIRPGGIRARVRGIQIHNKTSKGSCIGRRTAINLQDVKKDKLWRGQCAGAPDSVFTTRRLDARLNLSKSCGSKLKNRARVRLHVGTAEMISRLVLLDRDVLLPGQTALAQFVLETSAAALPGDRFVIRTFSPLKTIGGGMILDAAAVRHKRFDNETLEGLSRLEGNVKDVVEQVFIKSRFVPKSLAEAVLDIGRREDETEKAVESLCDAGKLVRITSGVAGDGKHLRSAERYLHSGFYGDLCEKLVSIVKGYFEAYPYKLLVPVADVQSKFLRFSDRQIFAAIIEDLCSKGVLCKKGLKVGPSGREVELKPAEQKIANRIVEVFEKAQFATPLEDEVCGQVKAVPAVFKKIVGTLIEKECLVRLTGKVTYHAECVEKARGIVTEYARMNGSITVAQLRDELGVSRKYALALLEYFDGIGLTKRNRDEHVLK